MVSVLYNLYQCLVRVSNTEAIGRVWPVNLLVAAATMGISIAIVSSISRPLAIVVDTIAIRSMVVRTALVDKRAGTSIISWLSRPLAIITTISITYIVSMNTLGASVVVADSMAISWLSRSLAISISSIAISSIVSMQTL